MQRSQNEEVREFLAAYETSVLTQMAAGSGQSQGQNIFFSFVTWSIYSDLKYFTFIKGKEYF
jgi:hypothetical protein